MLADCGNSGRSLGSIVLVMGIGLTVMLTLSALLGARDRRRIARHFRRLAETRTLEEARARFHAALPEYPPEVREEVYRTIQGLVAAKDFPVLPDDDVTKTLWLDPGDDIDITLESYFDDDSPDNLDYSIWRGNTAADFARVLIEHKQRAEAGKADRSAADAPVRKT